MAIDLHEWGAKGAARPAGRRWGGARRLRQADKLQAAARQALTPARLALPAAGAAAYLAAGAPVLGGLYPLGLCLAVSLPGAAGLWAAAGAALGCRAAGVAQAPAYWAALGAAALVRLLAAARRWPQPMVASAGAAAVCLCAVRSALALAGGMGVEGVFSAAAEGLLVLGVSYLLAGWFAAGAAGLARADTAQRAGAVLTGMLALAVAARWQVWGFLPARAAAAALVLAAAWRRGTAGGCTAGAAALAALCAARPDSAWAGAGLMAGALAAGLFFGEGRAVTAAVFCGAGALGALCAPQAGAGLLLMTELAAGSAAFCLIPEKWLERVPPAESADAGRGEGIDGVLAPRLEALGGALQFVGDTVQAVGAAGPRPPQQPLADAAAQQCCRLCRHCNACWIEHSFDTFDAFAKLDARLRRGEWVQAETLPDALKRRCVQPVTLAGTVNALAAARLQARDAWQRERHARAAVCAQYSALADALAGLAEGAAGTLRADPLCARRIRQMLREAGFAPLDAAAVTDGRGRLTVWATLPPVDFTPQELDALTQEASAVCRCRFGRCQVRPGETVCLTWRQAPRYTARFGVCSLPAAGQVSADAVRTHTGEWLCTVLCDGMGTGKAAAVDGALAARLSVRLLAAGFAPAQTARLVNAALGLKGGEEAATTLDLLRVDPCTGNAVLYKAGAAPSFVLRAGGRVETFLADSVPVGILDDVSGRGTSFTLAPGDTAVLISDGALAPGLEGLAALLAAHGHKPPDALAAAVARAARQAAPRPDDVTVAVLRLSEAAGA